MKENVMKKLLLIATGGTIASRNMGEGLQPKITGEELLSYVKEAEDFCDVDTVVPFMVDSTNICARHWIQLVQIIEEHYEQYDGFVLCHGTDTMAYTAAALSYLIQNNRKPVVITGAQKPIDLEITDARSNLMDSLRFASHDKACGVSIVFGGKVIVGTRAKKEFSKSYHAFSSIDYPEIALIRDQQIIFFFDEKERMKKEVTFYHRLNDNVLLLKLIPSMNPAVVRMLAPYYDALIIESFGVGGIPDYGDDAFVQALEEWFVKDKMVVLSTQVTHEGSDMEVYQVGKKIKERFPILESHDMTLEATVAKVMWVLGQGYDSEKRAEAFLTPVNHDLLVQE